MSWDFSGPQPEIIVYETQANIPKRFRANLIERKDGTETVSVWNIYFDATTYEGAVKRADTWWLEQRAKHDAAEESKAKRAADRAAAKGAKA